MTITLQGISLIHYIHIKISISYIVHKKKNKENICPHSKKIEIAVGKTLRTTSFQKESINTAKVVKERTR